MNTNSEEQKLKRQLRKRRSWRCLECGYSLAGHIGEVMTCPECGFPNRSSWVSRGYIKRSDKKAADRALQICFGASGLVGVFAVCLLSDELRCVLLILILMGVLVSVFFGYRYTKFARPRCGPWGTVIRYQLLGLILGALVSLLRQGCHRIDNLMF